MQYMRNKDATKSKKVVCTLLAILSSLPWGWMGAGVLVASCSDDDDRSIIAPSATGTMQDINGNTYQWVQIDTLDWMTSNLRSGIRWYRQGSKFAWSDSTECARLFDVFGNYYSLAEALEQCPEGWRLPTDDDWKSLERACGMTVSESDRSGWRRGAGKRLASSETVALSYGGELAAYYTTYIELYQEQAYGLYWSSTLDSTLSTPCAYIRKVTPGQDQVQRISTPTKTHWLSVRYCRKH